jgi:hypothetical protein
MDEDSAKTRVSCLSSLVVGFCCGVAVGAALLNTWSGCGRAMSVFTAALDVLIAMAITGIAFSKASEMFRVEDSARPNLAGGVVVAAGVAFTLYIVMVPGSFTGAFFANNGAGIC